MCSSSSSSLTSTAGGRSTLFRPLFLPIVAGVVLLSVLASGALFVAAQPLQRGAGGSARGQPGEGEHLAQGDEKTFMPEDYDPESAPPAGFDASKPPPGFDETTGQFKKNAATKNNNEKKPPTRGTKFQQQQPHVPQGGYQQPMPPGFKPNTGRKGDVDENIHWGGGSEDGGDIGLGGTGAGGGRRGKSGKAAPQPPKSSTKDAKIIEQKLTVGEQITTTPRLEAVKRLHSHLIVLYTAPGWRWCESGAALQNATRMSRLVVDRWASYTDHSGGKRGSDEQKKSSKKKDGGKGKKKGGKKDGGSEDDDDDVYHQGWDSSPVGAAARFAWVDCSHSAVLGPFHPCADVKQLPALGLFVNASETPEVWYDGYTDFFSVFAWIKQNVPNATHLEIPDQTKADERGHTERKKIQRYSSLLPRLAPKEAMVKAQTEPLLALLYEADCRTCREDTVLLETIAHYHNEKRRKRKEGANPSASSSSADPDDLESGEDDEMPAVVRIPVDAQVRSRWLGERDVPQIGFFDVTAAQTPQLYFGARNVTDLLAFTRYVSRLDVRIPNRAFNSQAQVQSPALFVPGGVNKQRLHTFEEVRKFIDEGATGGPGPQRLLYVHSTWQRPAALAAEMGNAAAAFYRELERRPGSVKVDFRVLVLCKLSPQERTKIFSMKIFSGRVAPFLLQITPKAASTAAGDIKFVNSRVSPAAFVQLGEANKWLAVASNSEPNVNVTEGHYFVELNTLAPVVKPIAGSASSSSLPLLLPFEYYADRDNFLVLATSYSGTAESATANDRALAAFDRSTQEIRALLDEELRLGTRDAPSGQKKDYIRNNVTFAVVDAARVPELLAKCNAPDVARKETAAGNPVMFRVARDKSAGAQSVAFQDPVLMQFGSASNTFTHVPWEAPQSSIMVLDALLSAADMPARPDSHVTELTSSNFERVIHDPTMGVLVMFYSSASDPHSQSLMPSFRKVAAAFKNDHQTVSICQLDVEKIDAATRKRYGLAHVPVIRWFEKGSFDKGIGENFPGTPFPEAIIEYVSEEMNLPYFDMEQVKSNGEQSFPAVTYKDFDAKIVHEMHRHVILYLSRGRFRNEAKLDVLRRMAAHFENHTDFMHNFTFARIDAVRYNKKLRKAGFDVDADQLPMLIYLPPDAAKFRKVQKFPAMSKPFAEVAIARWVTDVSNYPQMAELTFNFTEAEVEAERDPPLLGIRDLDQTNFMEFVAGKGDRVVIFYAPWCRASREFMPTFSKVAQHFEGDDAIQFGRIDVPNNEEIGHQQGIQAFPTIITYFEGSSGKTRYHGETYPGGPNGDTMIEYLTTIRQSSRVQAVEAYRLSRKQLVVNMNSSTFMRRVEEGSVHALVEFGVNWCGHCTFLESVMEDLAEVYATNRKKLLVAYVDCSETGKAACALYNITDNYPKLILFRRDRVSKNKNKENQNLESDTTVPIRTHYLYKDARFFDEIQSFIGSNVPSLVLTQAVRHKFQDKRNKEENDFFESLAESKKTGKPVKLERQHATTFRDGMPQTVREDTPEARKQKEEERKKADALQEAEAFKSGGKRPGTYQGKPRFTSFPAHVATYEYDSFVKVVSQNQPLVILNYEEPEDNDAMVAYSMMAQSMQPLVDRNMIKMGVIAGAGGDAAVSRLLGRHPSLTIFRGLAVPSSVRFDTGKLAAGAIGDGGDLTNVSHQLSFVEKHLKAAAKRSVEITSKNFEEGTQDIQFTTVVFFYAPWDEGCRKVAEFYDAAAQMLGHHEHIILTRVDVSRHSKEYMRLGKKPLPAIYVYDRVAKLKAKEKAWTNDKTAGAPVAPRYLNKGLDVTRQELVDFIVAEDPEVRKERDQDPRTPEERELAIKNRNRIVEDMEDQDDEFKALFAEMERADQEQDEVGKKKEKKLAKNPDAAAEQAETIYMPAFTANELDGTRYAPLTIPDTDHFHITMREWPQGALIFFTAEYCSHCPKFEDLYQQAVGPMRNSVVVALMDVTKSKGPMRRCGVTSLPALVYVRPGKRPGEEEDDLTVVHFRGQKTVEEMVRFGLANVQGLKRPSPGTLPPYPEMPMKAQPPSEAEEKDIALITRARETAEELVINVTSMQEISDLMYQASTIRMPTNYITTPQRGPAPDESYTEIELKEKRAAEAEEKKRLAKEEEAGAAQQQGEEHKKKKKDGSKDDAAKKPKETAASVSAAEAESGSYRGIMFVFVTPWCGASCDKARDIALVVANSMEGSMRVVIVNATTKDEFRTMQAAYDIRSVPVVAVRCAGEDGTLRRLAGSQLGSLFAAGWLRKASENIAVLFEGFCMKRYSKEELRQLSSMVPEAVVKELTPQEVARLRNENGIMAFIRNARACRHEPDCKETQSVFEKAAVQAKIMKDNRVKWVVVDATGDKALKSALRNRGMEVPTIVYLGEREHGKEESDKETCVKILAGDMFDYKSSVLPSKELLSSFVTQHITMEKKM